MDPRPSVRLPPLQRTFDATLSALELALAHQAELDKEIEALAAQAPYAEPVGWLRCFRGIATLSAMIRLAEIVDFQRFTHPRELMAYLGLVPSEYSSGEAQRRGAITKASNTHARWVLVEAARHYRHRPTDSSSTPPHRNRRRRPQDSLRSRPEPDSRRTRLTAGPSISAGRVMSACPSRRRTGSPHCGSLRVANPTRKARAK